RRSITRGPTPLRGSRVVTGRDAASAGACALSESNATGEPNGWGGHSPMPGTAKQLADRLTFRENRHRPTCRMGHADALRLDTEMSVNGGDEVPRADLAADRMFAAHVRCPDDLSCGRSASRKQD